MKSRRLHPGEPPDQKNYVRLGFSQIKGLETQNPFGLLPFDRSKQKK